MSKRNAKPRQTSFRFTPLEELTYTPFGAPAPVRIYPDKVTPPEVWAKVQPILEGKHRFKKPRPASASRVSTPPIDARGVKVWDAARKRNVWRFEGWTTDQAKADALADYLAAHKTHYGAELQRLIRLTPTHNKLNAERWAMCAVPSGADHD